MFNYHPLRLASRSRGEDSIGRIARLDGGSVAQ
jgi:hypothetical protein